MQPLGMESLVWNLEQKNKEGKRLIAPRFELRTLSEHEMLRIRDDQLHHATASKCFLLFDIYVYV